MNSAEGETPAPCTRVCDELSSVVKRGLQLLRVPLEEAQDVQRRLCSFVALANSGDKSETSNLAWIDAGAGLCETMLAWVSFHAFCAHAPSVAGLLRRSTLRMQR